MPYSPDERQRRSDLAKRLHRDGKFGGRQPARKSVEVRARRASELSAEIVERHRRKIEKAIVAGLDSSSTSQRLKAAELALKMGMRSEALDVSQHRDELQHLDRQQLIDALADKLGKSMAGRLVRARIAEQNGEVIDGSGLVTEITP